MGRHPAARQKVLDASRQIVMERGAGSLTFEEIAQVSGVTRGGITYHFPTKEALLRALVFQDIAQWTEVENELAPKGVPAETALLLAFIRAHTHEDPDRRRFVTGMLGAVTLDPPILDPAREFERERLEGIEWNDRNVRLQLLRMAAMGLFWADLFGCPDMEQDVRARLVSTLEALAVEWSGADRGIEQTAKES
ncbi:MAG: TetR/AcrR family transcriptional regulator [Pseudomonadota bacterium]